MPKQKIRQLGDKPIRNWRTNLGGFVERLGERMMCKGAYLKYSGFFPRKIVRSLSKPPSQRRFVAKTILGQTMDWTYEGKKGISLPHGIGHLLSVKLELPVLEHGKKVVREHKARMIVLLRPMKSATGEIITGAVLSPPFVKIRHTSVLGEDNLETRHMNELKPEDEQTFLREFMDAKGLDFSFDNRGFSENAKGSEKTKEHQIPELV